MDRSPEVISRLLLELAPWDAADEADAAKIPFDSPHESRDLLTRMVREGKATAHRFMWDGQRCGVLVTRVETGNMGRELVCMAMWGQTPDGEPMTAEIGRACEALARAEGCVCLRFHTCRPAMARYACEQAGYRISEIICRKALP
ncbi:MAG TPA: hypothetical protein PK322_04010 [Opitutaceae bacterium]|nr:hypothetical protein [Opitutaceae bacterium]